MKGCRAYTSTAKSCGRGVPLWENFRGAPFFKYMSTAKSCGRGVPFWKNFMGLLFQILRGKGQPLRPKNPFPLRLLQHQQPYACVREITPTLETQTIFIWNYLRSRKTKKKVGTIFEECLSQFFYDLPLVGGSHLSKKIFVLIRKISF